MGIRQNISGAWDVLRGRVNNSPPAPSESAQKKSVQLPAQGGRSSIPDFGNPYTFDSLTDHLKVVTPTYLLELIPIIRKLSISNPDMSQSLHNVTTLSNTGHKIHFDQAASPEEIKKMRAFIKEASKTLVVGCPGIDGVVNKMLAQIMVGGALSVEFIPNMALTGFDSCAFINPEEIRWLYNTYRNRYEPYQVVPQSFESFQRKDLVNGNLVKLNPLTFKYYGLGGDTDSPYGIPQFLAALNPIQTQTEMEQNINFIIKQMGLLGFLTLMLDKPDKLDNETETTYTARLNAFLADAKARTNNSFRDGVIVGYKGDTEFELHNATGRETGGAELLYQQNEQQVASGLKQDTSMWGRSYGTTESQITVVFTKMLSEFKNLHNMVGAVLEWYYRMVLTMGGFKFAHTVEVKFNRSTLADDLKFQQALEILIRNYSQLYWDGIISLDEYADALSYAKPDQKEPRLVPNTGQTPAQIAQAKKDEEAKKDKSDKKVRDKNKPGQKKL